MSCYSTDNDYGRPSQLSGIICGFDGVVSIYGTSKISVNGKDISTLSTKNITNTDNIKSGALTVHKRYNSVTIACTVSKIAQELGTSDGYALVGTLPYDCNPLYKIIDYHRFNGSYIGQIVIETTGEVKIGYTKKNDGTAANMPATSMYWTFTYTI